MSVNMNIVDCFMQEILRSEMPSCQLRAQYSLLQSAVVFTEINKGNFIVDVILRHMNHTITIYSDDQFIQKGFARSGNLTIPMLTKNHYLSEQLNSIIYIFKQHEGPFNIKQKLYILSTFFSLHLLCTAVKTYFCLFTFDHNLYMNWR